ncbi:MAG: DUF4097 family beta strand repeat-containing protein [Clostridia bacterium]
MKVVKKIGMALLILVGIVVALFLILVGYLFVMPSHSVFGYRLANYSESQVVTSNYNFDYDDVEYLDINTRMYDLNIYSSSNLHNKISATTNRDLYGFFKADQGDVTTKFDYDPSTKTLTANLYEPFGIKLRGDCYITIGIPQEMLAHLKGITLTTTRGNMNVGSGAEEMYSSNLALKTSSGVITLNNIGLMGTLEANIGGGQLTATTKTEMMLTSTYITSGKGKTNFNINTDKTMVFGDFVYNNTSTGYLYLNTIESLEYKGNGGNVYVKNVGILDYTANNTNLNVENIVYSSNITATGEGNVNIDTCQAYCDISTNYGDITIANANDKLSLVSVSGKITISHATKLIDATTTSGNINISFDNSVPFYSASTSYRQVLATTTSGRVTLSGVDYINVHVKSSKGYANIVFHDMASAESVLQTKSAQAFVQVPRGTTLTGDTNGADFIVTIISNVTPDVDAGFGKVDQTADNVYKYLAYGADINTEAQLSILSEDGYVYVTNGIV